MSDEKLVSQEIDYAAVIPTLPAEQEEWEAPKHVYFGKKLPSGKMEKEPVYVHQEFPLMLYGVSDGRVRALIVHNEAEREAKMAEGYARNPAAFGVVTCPTLQEVIAAKREKEATDPVLETATVEILKRPGRPRKAA
jgi:hypothetical protein